MTQLLTRFEHGLLRQMEALDDAGFGPKTWGAAVTEATEYLFRNGYIQRIVTADKIDYELTEKGRTAANKSWETLAGLND